MGPADLFDSMFTRKSVRKYEKAPLIAGFMDGIIEYAKQLTPLYPNIKTDFEIVTSSKGMFNIEAPHYFAIYSEKKDGYLENAGFMWEQMDLFISSLALGACWLGASKPTEQTRTDMELCLMMCFGKPAEPSRRPITEFKRKTLQEISRGSDTRFDAVRLAPSATNSQNWFFSEQDGAIHVYQKQLNPIHARLYDKMNRVDIGIAAAFLAIASEKQNGGYTITQGAHEELKGYTYRLTVI